MTALPIGEAASTPWSLSPLWFVALSLLVPLIAWLAFAWRRALVECPTRVRRAGAREMRRLLRGLRGSNAPPQSAHLNAWLRAAARLWDVRSSAPVAAEVSQAAHSLTGDAAIAARWRELWDTAEHALYAPNATPVQDWYRRASAAAAEVEVPKRERKFPTRLRHWLPTLSIALFVAIAGTPLATHADVPPSAPTTEEEPAVPRIADEVQHDAQRALQSNWTDWAAHHNLAAYQIQEGALNLAIAHAIAAFAQHPASSSTREVLRTALADTPGMDANLTRLLSGAWYERIPALMSAAGWQRLSLVAALTLAAGFVSLVAALYVPHARARHGWSRVACACGAALLAISLVCWNAYGTLNRPEAAVLLQAVNLSPVPTELVPEEETSPLPAGSVVVTGRTFLGWREISGGTNIKASGWIRANAVMPLYARR